MPEPFIFINSYRPLPGKEDEYREAFKEVSRIVEEQEPRMLYFAEHVSEDGATTTTVQVHADAENMSHHMELVNDHIQEAAQYLDWSSMSIDVYGSPTETVVEHLKQVAGAGVSVTIHSPAVQFDRFQIPEDQAV